MMRFSILLFVAAVLAGCMWEETYEECGFPPAQRDVCLKDSGDSDAEKENKESSNCVLEHPQCPEDYCVSFRGSAGFCSSACQTNADCPDGGTCQTFAFGCTTDEEGVMTCLKLCIKPSLVK